MPAQTPVPGLTNLDWVLMWAPYDQSTYQAVLEEIQAGDVVLEIGAGDLRLARQVAAKAKRVIAIEIHADLVMNAVEGTDLALPKNLQVIHATQRS